MQDIWQLFVSFTKVGLFGFGGGPSMIPLIQEEVVDAQAWLTQDEFVDAFAFGNSLPGPIATKIAGYVGYQVAGVGGRSSGADRGHHTHGYRHDRAGHAVRPLQGLSPVLELSQGRPPHRRGTFSLGRLAVLAQRLWHSA